MKVEGERELIQKLRAFGEDANRRVSAITAVTALEIATNASRNAPVDTGKLKQSINANKDTPYKWWVNVNISYGAYVEFGTGTYVEVPEEWKDLAWHYYVNGKGYMHPQPYLYPAYNKGRVQYIRDLKDAIDYLSIRFNRK